MRTQVMFDIDNVAAGFVSGAVVVFDGDYEAYWPFGSICLALASFYNTRPDAPQIAAAVFDGQVAGCLVTAVNSFAQGESNEIFVGALGSVGCLRADGDGFTFSKPTPFDVTAQVDGAPVALVGYLGAQRGAAGHGPPGTGQSSASRPTTRSLTRLTHAAGSTAGAESHTALIPSLA